MRPVLGIARSKEENIRDIEIGPLIDRRVGGKRLFTLALIGFN
jgi:hypothetical protein